MSFTRNRYDVENYTRDLYQTTRPGNFTTNLPRNSCTECFNPTVRNASSGNSTVGNLIDNDSDLMGLNVKATRCPESKYAPSNCNEEFKNSKLKHFDDCTNFVGESTRLSNPPCTLRGTGWNRWQWLCQNPQDRSIVPFNIELNTTIMAKDDHRPCIPQPLNQRLGMPVSQYNNPNVVMYNDQETTYSVSQNEAFNVDNTQSWRNCRTVNQLN